MVLDFDAELINYYAIVELHFRFLHWKSKQLERYLQSAIRIQQLWIYYLHLCILFP